MRGVLTDRKESTSIGGTGDKCQQEGEPQIEDSISILPCQPPEIWYWHLAIFPCFYYRNTPF
jgi:hypothetical protein